MTSKPAFQFLQHALLSKYVNTYGVVTKIEKESFERLILRLGDTKKREDHNINTYLDVIIEKDAHLFANLKVGDVVRCYNLEKSQRNALFIHGKNKMQIIAWSSIVNDMEVKICTIENNIPPDMKRINDLRNLHLFTQTDDLKQALTTFKHLVMIAQASGQNVPQTPPKLSLYEYVWSKISIEASKTIGFLREIPKYSNNFHPDNYFNLFAMVLGLYTCEKGFLLRVWDGSNIDFNNMLTKLRSYNIQNELIKYIQPDEVEKHTINILFFGESWKSRLVSLKTYDIVLVANTHVISRALGDLTLAMHEGLDNRRCVALVDSEHPFAVRIKSQCMSRLKNLERQTEVNEVLVNCSTNIRIPDAFFSQTSNIAPWNGDPSSTQNLISSELVNNQHLPVFNDTINFSRQKNIEDCSLKNSNINIDNLGEQAPVTTSEAESVTESELCTNAKRHKRQSVSSNPLTVTTSVNGVPSDAAEVAVQPSVNSGVHKNAIIVPADTPQCNKYTNHTKDPDFSTDSETDIDLNEQRSDDGIDNSYYNIKWEKPHLEYTQAFSNEQYTPFFKRLLKCSSSQTMIHCSWEDDLNAVRHLSARQQHHFKTPFRSNVVLWRLLLRRENTKLWAHLREEKHRLNLLIPVITEKDLFIFAAFPVVLLNRLFPHLKTIWEEVSKKPDDIDVIFQEKVIEELKIAGFFDERNLFISASLLKNFEDGYIFHVDDVSKFAVNSDK